MGLFSFLFKNKNLVEDFDEILNGVILPFIEKNGFNKKGNNFLRKLYGIEHCFNIQKSKYNSASDISFTVNLGVYSECISRIVQKEFSKVNFPTVGHCFFSTRLGLLSHNTDYWYKLTQKSKLEQIKAQLKNDLEKYLIPYFENYKSLNSIEEILKEKVDERLCSTNAFYLIAYYSCTNQSDKARDLLLKSYEFALKPVIIKKEETLADSSKILAEETHTRTFDLDNVKRIANQLKINLP